MDMTGDVEVRRRRYQTAGPYAAAAAALAGLVWRPDAYWPAAILLLVVPTVWRAIGFPIWHLAVMEGVALLATLALRAYCGTSGCGIDYRHPWHFLPDLTLAFLIAAPIGLGLAAMAPPEFDVRAAGLAGRRSRLSPASLRLTGEDGPDRI